VVQFAVIEWIWNKLPRVGSCFSPEGTTLNQPRVKRREKNERRATLGGEDYAAKTPKGWP